MFSLDFGVNKIFYEWQTSKEHAERIIIDPQYVDKELDIYKNDIIARNVLNVTTKCENKHVTLFY